jgi:hypothetical protein
MKKIYILLLAIISIPALFAQQSNERKVYIEINERVSYYEVNEKYEILKDTIYHSKTGFLIFPDYDVIHVSKEDYIILSYPDYINGTQRNGTKRTVDTSRAEQSPVHVDIVSKDTAGDFRYINGKKLAIKKSDFDALDKTDHYSTSWRKLRNFDLSFGVLTVPFKLRPKIDETNFTLTTDITIGPYFGVTKRLSSSRRFYMTIPATLGLSFINIDNNNTSNVEFDNDISVVPGITWSAGLIFQLEDFNIGFVLGQDYASGVGEKWRYNGELWYSFAIGYNFISQK